MIPFDWRLKIASKCSFRSLPCYGIINSINNLYFLRCDCMEWKRQKTNYHRFFDVFNEKTINAFYSLKFEIAKPSQAKSFILVNFAIIDFYCIWLYWILCACVWCVYYLFQSIGSISTGKSIRISFSILRGKVEQIELNGRFCSPEFYFQSIPLFSVCSPLSILKLQITTCPYDWEHLMTIIIKYTFILFQWALSLHQQIWLKEGDKYHFCLFMCVNSHFAKCVLFVFFLSIFDFLTRHDFCEST